MTKGGTNGDDVLRGTDAPVWVWDLAHNSQRTFYDSWTPAVPQWGKGHLTNVACYSVLRSRFTQEKFRIQKQSSWGMCWPCIPSYLARCATRRCFPQWSRPSL